MANDYIDYPIVQDPRDLMQRAFDYLKLKIPGWQPAEGNLDVWMIEAIMDEAADIGTLTSLVPRSIFRYFGDTLLRLTPTDASSAYATSTWFFIGTDGYTITAGTQVGIRDSAGNLIPFYVPNEVIIAPGVSQTTAGQIGLVAIEAGIAANDIGTVGGEVELIDPIFWVNNITLTTKPSGGVDAESTDEYLDRLARVLATLAPRPILPADFSLLATNVSGVQRAVTIDGYDPVTATYNNERMVTVVALDSAGNNLSAAKKTDLATYLDSLREQNFVVNIMDPARAEIDVTVTVTRLADYTDTDVSTRVETAILNFINPAIWGISVDDDPNDPVTWTNTTTIYYLELATAINNVPGVGRITTLTLGLHLGAQAAADLVLSGVVPLPFTNAADVVVNIA